MQKPSAMGIFCARQVLPCDLQRAGRMHPQPEVPVGLRLGQSWEGLGFFKTLHFQFILI